MRTDYYLASLIRYGIRCGLIEPCDSVYIQNQMLDALSLHAYTPAEGEDLPLEEILKGLLDDAVQRGGDPAYRGWKGVCQGAGTRRRI